MNHDPTLVWQFEPVDPSVSPEAYFIGPVGHDGAHSHTQTHTTLQEHRINQVHSKWIVRRSRIQTRWRIRQKAPKSLRFLWHHLSLLKPGPWPEVGVYWHGAGSPHLGGCRRQKCLMNKVGRRWSHWRNWNLRLFLFGLKLSFVLHWFIIVEDVTLFFISIGLSLNPLLFIWCISKHIT